MCRVCGRARVCAFMFAADTLGYMTFPFAFKNTAMQMN